LVSEQSDRIDSDDSFRIDCQMETSPVLCDPRLDLNLILVTVFQLNGHVVRPLMIECDELIRRHIEVVIDAEV